MKLKEHVTSEMLKSVGFRWNSMFNRYERMGNYGALNYTVIDNRIIKQIVSTPNFYGHTENNPKNYIQDLIEKGWVEEV